MYYEIINFLNELFILRIAFRNTIPKALHLPKMHNLNKIWGNNIGKLQKCITITFKVYNNVCPFSANINRKYFINFLRNQTSINVFNFFITKSDLVLVSFKLSICSFARFVHCLFSKHVKRFNVLSHLFHKKVSLEYLARTLQSCWKCKKRKTRYYSEILLWSTHVY